MNYLRKFYWLIGPNGILSIIISYVLTSLYEIFKFKDWNKNIHQKELLNEIKNNYFAVLETKQLDLNYKNLTQKFIQYSKNNLEIDKNKKFWISYLNSKNEKVEAAKLFINEKLIYLAANYLEAIPILYSIKYFKTIQAKDQKLSKSQLWHMDTTHKKIFKIFWSPKGVSSLQGPTTICKTGKKSKIWQYTNYPNFPSYFTDEQFKKSKLNKFETNEILLENKELSICDTCNLFHFGSRFNNERWIVILEFAPLKRFDYFHKPDKELSEVNELITSMF